KSFGTVDVFERKIHLHEKGPFRFVHTIYRKDLDRSAGRKQKISVDSTDRLRHHEDVVRDDRGA
ncbi:MAG: hypothetical protein V4692_14965, partial [Bdellovibrionota bacterium]